MTVPLNENELAALLGHVRHGLMDGPEYAARLEAHVAALAGQLEKARAENSRLVSERDAVNANAASVVASLTGELEKVREALRGVEWSGADADLSRHCRECSVSFGCPECGRSEEEGHRASCAVGAVLADSAARSHSLGCASWDGTSCDCFPGSVPRQEEATP